jgi:crotonobetainyl-CoA:carnitine CoA-transferase CaiB-like acyl-CoA transferase
VQTRAALLADPEARALGYVVRVGERWQAPAPAAFPDVSRSEPPPRPTRPPATCLEGVRVLDLSGFVAGPFCPMLLADLGADVTKIETPSGDPFRFSQFGFIGWNRGKRSLVLDVKRPEGRDVFLELVRAADVLVENQRPGVLERLGLGWEQLRAANPGLVHASITGYGGSHTLPGFDPIFQARTGLMAAQGGDDEPVFHTIPYNDYCAGALAALATTAALVARQLHGNGRRVDVSLFRTGVVDQAAEMASEGGRVFDGARGGRDHSGPSACRRVYQCADGWLCVVARTAGEVDALGRVALVPLGADEIASTRAIADLLRPLSRDVALVRLREAGVPAAPCLGFDELWGDPHLAANAAFATADYREIGTVTQAGPLIHFERTPIVYQRRAPRLGEHGAEVLGEIGVDDARVDALMAAGVVGRPASG